MSGEQKHIQPLREEGKGHIEPFVKRKGRNFKNQKVRRRKGGARKQVVSFKKRGKAEGKRNMVVRDVEKELLVGKMGHEKVYHQYEL